MREFNIVIRSFREIQAFVALAMQQPFEVLVGNERQRINGKDFMGMASLDYRFPLQVSVRCDQEQYDRFRRDAVQFLG